MKRTMTTTINKSVIRIGAATALGMFCPWVGVDVSTANKILVITLCKNENKKKYDSDIEIIIVYPCLKMRLHQRGQNLGINHGGTNA